MEDYRVEIKRAVIYDFGDAPEAQEIGYPTTLARNGARHTVDVEPSTPLLYVLRNDLDLSGPRFGCGLGQCGACTVLINGEAVRSCIRPVSQVQNVAITTLEGLSADGTHPLQVAWQEIDVPQCGYCQAGQIMSAVALIERNANPTHADIDNAMNGNICRCATYLRIRAAIHRAASGSD